MIEIIFFFAFFRHGIGRTDYYLLNDPELSFKDVVKMSLVDDPASFLREKFAESFKAECQVKPETEEKLAEKKPVKTEPETEIKKSTEEPVPEVKAEESKADESEAVTASAEPEPEISTETKETEKVEKMEVDEEEKPKEEEKLEKMDEEVKEKEEEKVKDTEEEKEKEEETEKEKEMEKEKSGGEEEIVDGKSVSKKSPKIKKKKVKKSKSPKAKYNGDDEEGADADEEEVDGDDEGDDNDIDDKPVDDSIYDFEDEVEPKKIQLTHVRKEKEENGEDEKVDEEEKKEKEEKPESEPAEIDEVKIEKEEKIEEKPKEAEVKPEQEEQSEEKPEIIAEVVKKEEEVASSSKDNDCIVESTKITKPFSLRKHFKEEDIKNMFSELEVVQPWARLHELDPFLWRDRCSPAPSEPSLAQLIAHSYQNPIKWPRDHAILVRLQHIIHAVEYKEWPVSSNFSAYSTANLTGHSLDLDISARNTPEVSKRDSSTPMSMSEGSEVITITTDLASKHHAKKKKHHIAIDVETERAKLHALLNCTALTQPSSHSNMKSLPIWEATDESLSEDSRRSTPVSLQPPPAHQQTSRTFTGMPSSLTLPFDLSKFHTSSPKTTTNVLSNTNSLAPMDLSSGLSKSDIFKTKDTEAQDLSIAQDLSSKPKLPTAAPAKGKLDKTLDNIFKRKNIPTPEEPVVEKEKKRRKLDEIVMGLSAAKEQQSGSSLFSDIKKTPCISPSVTVTPANMHPPPSSTPASKPFTITVTSVPASSSGNSEQEKKKDNLSSFLSQAEQQHGKLLLKQQQQLLQQQQNLLQQQALSSLTSPSSRKSYEAMVADLSKVADFTKMGSYSHEAKVS